MHQPINERQKQYYLSDPPLPELLAEQHENFVRTLRKFGVIVHWVDNRSDSPLQVFTRDVATVVDRTMVVTAMANPLRQNETAAVNEFLNDWTALRVDVKGGVVEGGDIILSGDKIFVGLGERTDEAGLAWLRNRFSTRYRIIPLRLEPKFLHLDGVLNLVGRDLALIYAPGLKPSALEEIHRHFSTVEVSTEERETMAVNLLSLSPTDVVANPVNRAINETLRRQGITVHEVAFGEINKLGGSFRCASCPLVRDAL
jgi:N-dimethylarginine dimethylaminohydrolase